MFVAVNLQFRSTKLFFIMASIRVKATAVPTKVCPYADSCYRKNPIHFAEFFHPHLHEILEKGINDTTSTYDIPSDLFLSKDVVTAQLQILAKLFPNIQGKKNVQKRKDTHESTKPKHTNNPETICVSDDDCSPKKTDSRYTSTEVTKPNSNGTAGTSRSVNPVPGPSTSETDGSRLSKKPKVTRNIKDYIQVVLPKGQMAKKLEKAAPYNFFLTAITDSKPTHNEPLSVTLQEILDESLGEIESSVQINFMVDIGWLLGHYYFAGCLDTPMLVLYGDETPDLKTISEKKPQVTAIKVQMSSPFATHHTKMMLLGYKDGSMRVVISTANLYEDDWHNRTQGVWISPKLDALPNDSNTDAGESSTGFKNDLMLYLVEYKIAKLQPWIARIRKTDFSSINVFFVASCPGGFRETVRGHPWGHARLGYLLNRQCAPVPEVSPIVAQSSSIGSLGVNVQAWVLNDFANNLRKDSKPLGIRRIPPFKMIYPSFGNVKNSHDGLLGGGCLPYGKNTNDKQPWLQEYLHKWSSNARNRSRAMPHIKSYCRWSEEGLYWFCLTSANLSKAAWGAFNKNTKIEPTLRIMNYEAGVLFLPRFITGEDTFPMCNERNGIPPFPMPYDIPLTPYGPDDKPFLMDYLVAMGP